MRVPRRRKRRTFVRGMARASDRLNDLHRPRSRELGRPGGLLAITFLAILTLAIFTFLAILAVLACFALPRSSRTACRLPFLLFTSATFVGLRFRDFLPLRFFDLLAVRFGHLRLRAAAAGDVFLAVDRRDVGWIPVEIGASESIVLAVRVDPLPELFGGDPSLRPGVRPLTLTMSAASPRP